MSKASKKILFLLSDTGGGHRASAEAIGEAIEYLHPGKYELVIDDLWKNHMPWPICCIPDTYGWMTGPGKSLWLTMWKLSSYHRLQSMLFGSFLPFTTQNMVKYITSIQPDIVISVHPLMNHLGVHWLKKAGLDVPFVTVVTDMVSFHPSWICPDVDRCFVSTKEAWLRAVEYGMPYNKLTLHGHPVGLKFSNLQQDKANNKKQLGLDPGKPTILMTAGGEGQPQLYKTARLIAENIDHGQLLIVAGRNKKLENQLKKVAWNIPTKVFGFVENMPTLMGASDILITKAGPSTLCEGFIAGLPVLISDYIPGQETGNVTFVKQHGAGTYAPQTKQLVSTLKQWLDNSEATLQELADNGTALAKPHAALHIASDICQIA